MGTPAGLQNGSGAAATISSKGKQQPHSGLPTVHAALYNWLISRGEGPNC